MPRRSVAVDALRRSRPDPSPPGASRGRRPPVRSPRQRRDVQLARRFGCRRSSSLHRPTRPASAPFRVRAYPRYPASYPARPAEGPTICPGFLSPFGHRRSLLGSSFSRWGTGPSSRSAYRHLSPGPDPIGVPRSTRTRHDRVGCPLNPGDGGALTTDAENPVAACRIPAACPCTPAPASHRLGLNVTGRHRGFTCVHPSGLPLACSPRMEQGPLGFSPGLRTPPSPATHARVGTGHEHWPGTTLPTT
jgi:hypothetical protein